MCDGDHKTRRLVHSSQQKTRKVQISKTYETLSLKKGGKKLVMWGKKLLISIIDNLSFILHKKLAKNL